MLSFEKSYWDKRYTQGMTSGYGSYGPMLERKLGWLKGLDINSIAEVGCGDFNFGSNLLKLYPDATYTGYDISEVIIDKNKELYPQYTFTTKPEELPQGDLLLCVDVLLHVIEDEEVENLLKDLEKRWTKYLALTAYERDETLATHVRIRKFDYKRFGEPIVREISEENGEMYFYLFKK